jgi:Ca-activated chloride channel homolog
MRRLVAPFLSLLLAAPALAQDAEEPEIPGEGVLEAVGPKGVKLGACPLEHTDVRLDVAGDLVSAHVTQTFANPFDHRIEAVYAFPLPEHAAVHGFRMVIGNRTIEGVLEKREEARKDYEEAKARGESAALLDQERPNLFTQSVANIPPGGKILVTLDYVDALPYSAGAYHVAFPLTIGPRYVPATVADADKVTPPVNLSSRPGHDVSVTVEAETGVPLLGVQSTSHAIVTTRAGASHATVTLAPGDTIPNRDFLLDLAVAPTSIAAGVVAHTRRAGEGYLKLFLVPAEAPAAADVTPKELVFVLDTSGSQYGVPMDISKGIMHQALSHLGPDDTFAVLRYSDAASALSKQPMANTPDNVARALAFVDGLEGEGGTNAVGGVRAAFAYPHDASKVRIVVFMTDGFIGNEEEILGEIRKHIGDSRLFSVGVGSSVNRYLISGMAAAGRGAEIVATPRDKIETIVDRVFAMIDRPYLTDVTVDWGGLDVSAATPAPIPDLFAGQPLALWARYGHGGRATVRVRGKIAGRPWTQNLDVTLPESEPAHGAVATLWARREIDRLTAEQEVRGADALKSQITDLALDYGLATAYTSFVAIEQRAVADAGGPPERIDVASELPEGVSPDRIFGELSLQRMQPGDPELRVFAPADSRAVTAVFPFGETKAAKWDPRSHAWIVRFLVPRATPEGVYRIRVLITLADGRRADEEVDYTVDGGAPKLTLRALGKIIPGLPVMLEARQIATESDERLARAAGHRGRLRAIVIDDVARVSARMPDGQIVALHEVEHGVWQATWTPMGHGGRAVLTAVDMAGNTGIETLEVK